MKNIKNLLLVMVIVQLIACTGSGSKDKSTMRSDPEFEKLLEDYYQEGLRLDPLQATVLGDDRYNDQFPDYASDAWREKQKEYYTRFLERVNQFDEKNLNASEKMSKEVLNWECKIRLEGLNFRDDYLPINQMWSVNLRMGQWAGGTSAQPFKNFQDYINWLRRVDGYLQWMDTAEKKMRTGIDSGYVLPTSLIVKVIPQLEAMAKGPVEEHLFFMPVKRFPESFSQEEKDSMTRDYTAMVKDKIMPAYAELLQFVSTEYLAAGRESSGYGDLPHGPEEYRCRIKRNTTTDMTADKVFELGLREVERIRGEMEKVKEEVGYEGDLQSFFDFVRNKKELMPFTEPQQVLDHFQEIHDRMKPRLVNLFSK